MKTIWTLLLTASILLPTVHAATAATINTGIELSDDAPAKDKKKKKKKTKMSKKDMSAAIDGYKSTIADLEDAKAELESQLNDKEAELNELKEELSTAKSELTEAKEAPAKFLSAGETGLTFRLQIGAYNTIDLARYFAEPKLITAEEVEGLNKYMIGYFDSFEIAKQVEGALRKAGIKDAWVVPYNDGSRISDDEAEQLLGKPIRD